MQSHEEKPRNKKIQDIPKPGARLRKKSSAIDHMGKKLRHSKADTKETVEEAKRKAQIKRKSRKEIHATAALSRKFHQEVSKHNEDGNAGVDAVNESAQTIEQSVVGIYAKKMRRHTKQTRKQRKSEEATTAKQKQKDRMKKQVSKQAKEVAEETVKTTERLKKSLKEIAKGLVQVVKKVGVFVVAHAKVFLIIGILAVIVVAFGLLLQSCGVMFAGTTNIIVSTSYTAQDKDIIETDNGYKVLEQGLSKRIENIESEYPGYDEYRYHLAEINHNPFELAAILTVLLEDYTRAEASTKLQQIFDSQYQFTTRKIVEQRTRETGGMNADGTPETEEYDYYILDITLINRGMDAVARSMGFATDQMQRYEILVETKGNKPYLFADDIYAHGEDPLDYQIPGEALTDE